MTMYEPLPQDGLLPMELPSMSSAEGSPAKTSALLERVQDWRGRGPASGAKSPVLLANYDHSSSSWKTSQLCLDGDLGQFSETWPSSGSMLNGTAFLHPPLAHPTDETGSGLWPTPDVRGFTNDGSLEMLRKKAANREEWSAMAFRKGAGAKERLWPTPVSDDTGWRRSKYPQGGTALSTAACGPLNPTWVEWLMGFPLGWTDLRASETP